MSGTKPRAPLTFDGIVCMGGQDWWYHNRGHFDTQILRRLARRMPVLFVNSIAVRMPSLAHKAQFADRVGRKLKSIARGVVNVENDLWVFSPLSVPGTTGRRLTGWALAPQIRLAAARAGIARPLLWIHCPAGADLVDSLPSAAVVFQRTDRFEAYPEADPAVVRAQVAAMKSRADLVLYAAPHLMADEGSEVRRALLVTHGVDFADFAAAGESPAPDPLDIADLPHPRVGFIGGIDRHTFDPELFATVAARLPDVNFVLVGACSLPEGWCPLPNVRLLGRKPYEEVARYMAAMDALIMPWNDSDWIKACNPVKLKEYLAVGRPVVTTDFPALDGWRQLVRTAAGADAFAAAVRAALSEHYDAAAARAAVAAEGWDAKADLVERAIADMGLVLQRAPGAAPRAA